MSFLQEEIDMNDSEARRRELLRQTRRLYHETGRSTPVIHPRYGNLTTSVTEDDAAEDHSFLFRLGLSILCFACFVWMDYGKIEVAEVNSGRILNEIEKQITPKECGILLPEVELWHTKEEKEDLTEKRSFW